MDYDKELALWAELESEWKKNLPRYSPQELLEIFPEAKEIIPVKISELIDAKHELERTIKKNISYVRAKHFTSIGKHILRELLKMNKGMKLVKINANISR